MAVCADLNIFGAAGGIVFANLGNMHHFFAAFWTDGILCVINKCRSAANCAAFKGVADRGIPHFPRFLCICRKLFQPKADSRCSILF